MLKRHWGLFALALAAFGLVVARAATQSIVIDEADSYSLFATHSWASVFAPSSGNHVLNTLLTVFSTHVFPVTELSLRLPAVFGAAVYIVAAVYLCIKLSESVLIGLSLFVCLVYNPFVLDYLVAARGYSLAVGFFLASIALLSSVMLSDGNPRACPIALASLSLGLSFCANFSFAFADGILMIVFLAWAIPHSRARVSLAAAGLLPGALVALLICGDTLRHWPKGQLYFGAESLYQTWQGLVSASFDSPNERIVGLWLASFCERYPQISPSAALVTAAVALAMFFVLLGWRHQEPANRLTRFASLLLSVLAATVLVHWIAFKAIHLLLPKNRTGLFLVVLFTLFFGAAAASCWRSKRSRFMTGLGVAVLVFNAVYFLGCLRMTYFKEWRFNADSKEIYWRLVDLNRRCDVDSFSTEWRYVAALNFYRSRSGYPPLPQFVTATANTPGERAYIAYYRNSRQFLREQGLPLAYFNADTGAVIAVRGCTVAPLSITPP
jgi:hypothetical protein